MSWNDTKMKEENKVIFHTVYECEFKVSSRFGNFLLKSIKKHTRTCFFSPFFAEGGAGVEPRASCILGTC